MDFHLAWIPESLVADGALERLLACVHAHVHLKTGALHVGAVTVLAAVGRVHLMALLVRLKIGLILALF